MQSYTQRYCQFVAYYGREVKIRYWPGRRGIDIKYNTAAICLERDGFRGEWPTNT